MAHVGQDIVLRVGGDSAAGGIVATGEIFAYMAAWAGLEVYTTRTIPAEIKGGHVMYQMRAALDPLTAQGDELDVLLAYDEETFERYYKLLKADGLLVFNSNDLQVETTGHRHRRIGVPMHDIAKSLNFARGYNMVAVAESEDGKRNQVPALADVNQRAPHQVGSEEAERGERQERDDQAEARNLDRQIGLGPVGDRNERPHQIVDPGDERPHQPDRDGERAGLQDRIEDIGGHHAVRWQAGLL